MLHKLNKLVFLYLLFSFYLPYAHSSENNLSKGTSSQSIDYDKYRVSDKEFTLTDRFLDSFTKYRSFEEGTKPENQFAELFGFGGFQDQRLKSSAFKLWEVYKEESKKQVGTLRLRGTDINNTYNGSLSTDELNTYSNN